MKNIIKKASALFIVLLTSSFLTSVVPANIGNLELTATQNSNYQVPSLISEEPFAMIIMNDPQIFWHWDDLQEAMDEQHHKRNAIRNIWTNDPQYRYFLGNDPVAWPESTGGNLMFDPSKLGSPIPQVEGVIINGDLTYGDPADGRVFNHPEYGPQTDEWWYRYYYVSEDPYFGGLQFPGLRVYGGFGNHDSKWTVNDLGCALLLDSDNNERLWTNFPSKTTLSNIHWDTNTRKGSLSYSWNVHNYHFVQTNMFNRASKWLNVWPEYLGGGFWGSGEIELTSCVEWLKKDLATATDADKRIIVNMHYPFGAVWADLANLFQGTNVVAVFIGHTRTNTGHFRTLNATNAFNQTIPLFQAGHSGNFYDPNNKVYWYNDHQLLVVECADWYMNIGLVGCGTWGGPGGLPYWEDPTNDDYMMTWKIDTLAPIIIDGPSQTPAPVYAGDEVEVEAFVRDDESGLKQVLLNCTFTNSTNTWNMEISMDQNPDPLLKQIWNATIPGCRYGTSVTYTIVAEDNMGNTINSEEVFGFVEFGYEVIPEFFSFLMVPIFMGATLLAVVITRRKHKANPLTYIRQNQQAVTSSR